MRVLRNLGRPGRILRSGSLSFAHERSRFWRFPIVAAWSARIERAHGAEIRVGDRLVLGFDAYPPRHGISERSHHGPLIWLLDSGSRLETHGRVVLGQGAQICIANAGRVEIGDGTYLNPNARILCMDSISIGSNCAISWDVQIMDFDGHDITVAGTPRANRAPIVIGDGVLVGSRATILKGVEIGDGAIVGAGAVVTRSVPARALVAGNPAKVIHTDVRWDPNAADSRRFASFG
jgi:acetyltransferase-like isoleucine patch superfamily enzyme